MKKGKTPYVLIPCTIDPEIESTFKVTFEADAPVTAQLISKEQEWTNSILVPFSLLALILGAFEDLFYFQISKLMKVEKCLIMY